MKTFDRHGNESYIEPKETPGQWPIGTWLQKRLLHLRLADAADSLGMKGFVVACREETSKTCPAGICEPKSGVLCESCLEEKDNGKDNRE